MLGQLGIHPSSKSLYLATNAKINSKCIIDPNVKPKTMKHLEENIGENICDLGLGKHFLDMILITWYKEKNC